MAVANIAVTLEVCSCDNMNSFEFITDVSSVELSSLPKAVIASVTLSLNTRI